MNEMKEHDIPKNTLEYISKKIERHQGYSMSNNLQKRGLDLDLKVTFYSHDKSYFDVNNSRVKFNSRQNMKQSLQVMQGPDF